MVLCTAAWPAKLDRIGQWWKQRLLRLDQLGSAEQDKLIFESKYAFGAISVKPAGFLLKANTL